MRLYALFGALALSTTVNSALSDSSPWLLFSTAKFQDTSNTNQVQTSSSVLKHSKEILASCPTEHYLVVSQPGVHGVELGRPGSCAMPHLCRAIDDVRVKSKFTVAEVVGHVTHPGIAQHIRESCAQKNKVATVNHVDLVSIPREGRTSALFSNDATLATSLDAIMSTNSFTIIFYSPPGEPVYEAEFSDSLHIEMKRDMHSMPMRRKDNDSERDTRPLFEKYQFFTPGVFMGIITALILLSLLNVGIRALSSLQVPYGAFEKENGPAAHKKYQ
ncbi:hypothetical protein CDD82_6494 [Ophiocordyceps australis]|uniref:Protein BIG1 n=1 Tax=Ophiocordyceps australis TaxID=1399860 RepID=A0A2C5YWQ6_9HYPO|nr:hypothetical protein CDD82_6494 [Ophiocordyceps australis]